MPAVTRQSMRVRNSVERILERKKATLEAECERLRREYRIAVIDYERAQISRRDAA